MRATGVIVIVGEGNGVGVRVAVAGSGVAVGGLVGVGGGGEDVGAAGESSLDAQATSARMRTSAQNQVQLARSAISGYSGRWRKGRSNQCQSGCPG